MSNDHTDSNFKQIIFVLPRHPYPPYAGQVRLAFNRCEQLKKKGYTVNLFSISNKALINVETEAISKLFDNYHHVKLGIFDSLQSILIATLKRIIVNQPLQANFYGCSLVKDKFVDFINQFSPHTTLIHYYSIRSFFLWGLAWKFGFRTAIDLVDSSTLNINRKIQFNKIKSINRIFWESELIAVRNFEQKLPLNNLINCYIAVSAIDLTYLNSKNTLKILSGVGIHPLLTNLPRTDNDTQKELLFFGSLSYEPNQSALKW